MSEWVKVLLLATLGILVTACSTKSPGKAVSHSSQQSRSVRVGTYNVFTGAHDSNLTANTIRRMRADVVMLQELSPKGAELLREELKKDFPYHHFSEGVAILSRFPLRNPRYERSQQGINGYLFAEVHSPCGRFQVASIHLDPLRIWSTREKWSLPYQLVWGHDAIHREEVRQIANSLRPGIPTILGGDFNSVSGQPIRKFREMSYMDSFASVNKDPDEAHTLHFKLFGIKTGRRIDYILHDKSFQTIQSHVIAGTPSDHDAVVSVLRWK